MKQFEKWNKMTNVEPNAVFYINRKEGWKAALEWVLNHTVYDPNDTGADLGIIPNIDFIEKELNAKT